VGLRAICVGSECTSQVEERIPSAKHLPQATSYSSQLCVTEYAVVGGGAAHSGSSKQPGVCVAQHMLNIYREHSQIALKVGAEQTDSCIAGREILQHLYLIAHIAGLELGGVRVCCLCLPVLFAHC